MHQNQWNDGIVQLKEYAEPRGNLVPIPFDILPFEPKRAFYIYDVPDEYWRGSHAHKECEQVLICLHGQIDVTINNTTYFMVVTDAIYLPKMTWARQQFFHGGTVLVLASHPYDKNDYIRDYKEFQKCVSC